MASGSGTGTPISGPGAPFINAARTTNPCAISLARYAQIIGYDEAAFFGIYYDGQEEFPCNSLWSEWQRQAIARALSQAQQMLEDFIRYPLCVTWITGQLDESTDGRFVDEQPYCNNPIVTRWGYVLRGGVQANADLSLGEAVDLSDPDVAVIGPFAATITDTTEVRVTYPDGEREITPSRMTYSAGNLTIYVPRCRLLLESILLATGGNTGPDKADDSNFLTTVDVKRVYNDPTTHAKLMAPHTCSLACTVDGCTEDSDDACIVVKQGVIGIVNVLRANNVDGTWTRANTTCCNGYDRVRLNYMAGQRTLTPNTEDVIVRLAHSLMPTEPCGCDVIKLLWERDRYTPDILTRERLNAPFGTSDGAYFAYQWAKSNAIVRGRSF